jgi:uncharacterized membrane protein
MSFFAPFNTYDTLHPLLVHFPIALLLVAPLFVVLGLLVKKGDSFKQSALILMVLGLAALYVTASTGNAAKKVVERTPPHRKGASHP